MINMSMNLNCDKIDLWQTPTQITYMCVVQPDGSVPYELTGKKAIHALRIYQQWVDGRSSGQWKNIEDLYNRKREIKSHLEEIEEVIKNNRRIKVWVM